MFHRLYSSTALFIKWLMADRCPAYTPFPETSGHKLEVESDAHYLGADQVIAITPRKPIFRALAASPWAPPLLYVAVRPILKIYHKLTLNSNLTLNKDAPFPNLNFVQFQAEGSKAGRPQHCLRGPLEILHEIVIIGLDPTNPRSFTPNETQVWEEVDNIP